MALQGEPRVDTFALRKQLNAKLFPLVILLMLLVSLSAPGAFLWLRFEELQTKAHRSAEHFSHFIHNEIREHPILWSYNTLKLLRHIRATYREDLLQQLVLLNHKGQKLASQNIQETNYFPGSAPIWGVAKIYLDSKFMGEVWVGISTRQARKDASILLLFFMVLGGLLAWMLYRFPNDAMAKGESRILLLFERLQGAQDELTELNQNLEGQVRRRTQELDLAYQELQQKDLHFRALSSRAITFQEQERRAIARELHDSIGQSLTAIRIQLQLLESTSASKQHESLAKTGMQMVDQTIEEVRRAIKTLGPAILDDLGLFPALQKLCEDFDERATFTVHYEIKPIEQPLSPSLENACYRIIQESLTNILKHAQAQQVHVNVETTSKSLHFSVKDDGIGFQADGQPPRESRGIVGMKERVELLEGNFSLDSTLGQGTIIRVTLPL